MPIMLATQPGPIPAGHFSNEEEFKSLLRDHPELLLDDEELAQTPRKIKFVDREVHLDDAGIMDLLFVDDTGVLIAVEAKLVSNADARRKVVAQAIEYASGLTPMTVTELDRRVNNKLSNALENLAEGEKFEELWELVEVNLRAGKSRIVVALDEAPPSLEKIFQFLANHSNLNVQLLTIQRYPAATGEILVSQSRVNPELERSVPPSPGRDAFPELEKAMALYNEAPVHNFKCRGTAPNYRLISLGVWEKGGHYEFFQSKTCIGVKIELRKETESSLKELLLPFNDRSVADGKGTLKWYEESGMRRLRLEARFSPEDAPPDVVAAAMRDLLTLTSDIVIAKLKELRGLSSAG